MLFVDQKDRRQFLMGSPACLNSLWLPRGRLFPFHAANPSQCRAPAHDNTAFSSNVLSSYQPRNIVTLRLIAKTSSVSRTIDLEYATCIGGKTHCTRVSAQINRHRTGSGWASHQFRIRLFLFKSSLYRNIQTLQTLFTQFILPQLL